MLGVSMPKHAWGKVPIILFSLAGAYLLLVYGLPLFQESSRAAGDCPQPQKQLLASGRSPHGADWAVTAGVHITGDCEDWLLSVGFNPTGSPPGSWSYGFGIPAGGHLPNSFTISARDEVEDAERVVGGIVGSRVRSIEFVMSKGSRIVTHPRLPTQKQRRRFTWLRNMRYFLRFYPTGRRVKAVRLLDKSRKTIFAEGFSEGVVNGPQ